MPENWLYRKPIHPIIFQGMVEILMRDFNCDVDQAVSLGKRLIVSMRSKDMDVVMGDWMEHPEILKKDRRPTWEQIGRDAEEWIESPASPMNRPELR
jgi:hypothetical protein